MLDVGPESLLLEMSIMPDPTYDTMSSDSGTPRAKGHHAHRRIRTDAQMAHKRLGDREKQKIKRAESKLRMQRMENDVAYLRRRMEEFVASPSTILQCRPNQDMVAREASWLAQSTPNDLSVSTVLLV